MGSNCPNFAMLTCRWWYENTCSAVYTDKICITPINNEQLIGLILLGGFGKKLKFLLFPRRKCFFLRKTLQTSVFRRNQVFVRTREICQKFPVWTVRTYLRKYCGNPAIRSHILHILWYDRAGRAVTQYVRTAFQSLLLIRGLLHIVSTCFQQCHVFLIILLQHSLNRTICLTRLRHSTLSTG